MENETKKARRARLLQRHYDSLAALASICGTPKADGKKLSLALLKIENAVEGPILHACNGTGYCTRENELDEFLEPFRVKVQALFGGKLEGFFINTDPRGHALKIDDAQMRTIYKETGLHQDWGGYGILAPSKENFE